MPAVNVEMVFTEEPGEQDRLFYTLFAEDYVSVIRDLDKGMRSTLKYREDISDAQRDIVRGLQDYLWDLIREYELRL